MSNKAFLIVWAGTLVALLALVWAPYVMGAPFLICDPDPNCQTYNVYADGQSLATVDAPLNYDLQTDPPGGISYTAECCNYRGCSDQSDPFVSLNPPSQPTNLTLDIEGL